MSSHRRMMKTVLEALEREFERTKKSAVEAVHYIGQECIGLKEEIDLLRAVAKSAGALHDLHMQSASHDSPRARLWAALHHDIEAYRNWEIEREEEAAHERR